MLFPAMYQLGVRAGSSLYEWIYVASAYPLPSSPAAAWEGLVSFPMQYKDWWWNLVSKDPLHVFVETTLILSIVYMVVSRNTEGYRQHETERLSSREQNDLLREWKTKGRAPLAPSSTVDSEDNSSASSPLGDTVSVVVHKQRGRFMEIEIADEQSASANKTAGANVRSVLNFASFDLWGMQSHDGDNVNVDVSKGDSSAIKDASKEALNKYGCGSCGPRGFYGTIDTHLQLEEEISKFTKTEGAIMYSDGASTCSSTVAAFAKRGDLLIVDEGVYEPLLTGVLLSRATVKWFKHNDMEDLERVLMEVQQTDKKLKRASNAQRRFIVVEGLYKNLGTICPLDQLVKLKHKYHYRMILDESFSFGSLGKTGKGALELHGQRPMYDAEIITIALENSLGSVGGVTVGNEEVVDHQRLSGAGYCFSASAPPFTASAAISSLHTMENEPKIYSSLQTNLSYMYEQLKAKLHDTNAKLASANDEQPANKSSKGKKKDSKKTNGSSSNGDGNNDKTNALVKKIVPMVVTSDERSPIVVTQFEDEIPNEAKILSTVMRECLRQGVAVVATGKQAANTPLNTELAPAIRLTVTALHTKKDIDTVVSVLCSALLSVCQQ